jgi:hypothetical protein
MLQASMQAANPKFAATLSGTIADEQRHVGFGENRIGSLIQEHPEKKAEVQQMQKEMSHYMLATFADRFREGELEGQRRRDRVGRIRASRAGWPRSAPAEATGRVGSGRRASALPPESRRPRPGWERRGSNLDGVVYERDRPVSGAPEAIARSVRQAKPG